MAEAKKERFVFLKKFLMTVGIIAVIFIFLFILLFVYIVMSKPLGIDINPFKKTDTSYDHPLLTTDQENLLRSLGVDLTTIPTLITPAQEKCAIEVLGQARVDQIKSGSAPSINDYLKAKSCF